MDCHKLPGEHEMFTLLTDTTKHIPIYIKRLESKKPEPLWDYLARGSLIPQASSLSPGMFS